MHPTAPLHKLMGQTKHYSTFGNIQASYATVEEERDDAPNIDSVKRAVKTWKFGGLCSKTEKRTYAAQSFNDAIMSSSKENMNLPLQQMGLKTLPNAPFRCPLFVTNLKVLNLSNNAFDEFPLVVTLLTNLESLNLNNNNLKKIPDDIKNLTKLSQLALSGNEITYLPEAIGKLINLVTLCITGNKLTTLPKSIGELQKLETLYAFENQIQTLPAEIGQLHATTISVYENKLEVLPKEFVNIKELKNLDLSSNNLRSLPSDIGNLTQLYQLGIYGNKDLADLPDSLEKCFHITTLNVADTKITKERWLHFLNIWEALKTKAQ